MTSAAQLRAFGIPIYLGYEAEPDPNPQVDRTIIMRIDDDTPASPRAMIKTSFRMSDQMIVQSCLDTTGWSALPPYPVPFPTGFDLDISGAPGTTSLTRLVFYINIPGHSFISSPADPDPTRANLALCGGDLASVRSLKNPYWVAGAPELHTMARMLATQKTWEASFCLGINVPNNAGGYSPIYYDPKIKNN